MKTLFCILCLATVAAFGTSIGDTYQQVIAEKGSPKSHIDAGSLRVLSYPDVTIRIRDNLVVSIKPVAAAPQQKPPAAPAQPATPRAQMASIKRQLDAAVVRVVAIINQPVATVERPTGTQLWVFYFHDGATRPDFNNVDVRATQETSDYAAHPFITFRDSPNLTWVGSDCEFNSMTKYFYADRSVPKKRLTEAEMLEINKLYRIIGQSEQQLAQLGYSGTVP